MQLKKRSGGDIQRPGRIQRELHGVSAPSSTLLQPQTASAKPSRAQNYLQVPQGWGPEGDGAQLTPAPGTGALKQHPWESNGCPGHLLLPSAGMHQGKEKEDLETLPKTGAPHTKTPLLPPQSLGRAPHVKARLPHPGMRRAQAQCRLDQGRLSTAKLPLTQTFGLRFPGYSPPLPICS